MPLMIPPVIPDHALKSEKMVFEILKHSPKTRDWVIFQGVDIPPCSIDPFRIDFVIFIPGYLSVICLQIGQNENFIGRTHEAIRTLKDHFLSFFSTGSLLSLGGIGVQVRDSDHVISRIEVETYVTEVLDNFDKLVNILT